MEFKTFLHQIVNSALCQVMTVQKLMMATTEQVINVPTHKAIGRLVFIGCGFQRQVLRICINVKYLYNNIFTGYTGFFQDSSSSDYFLFHGSIPAARPVFC
jgi:hypothetical protein